MACSEAKGRGGGSPVSRQPIPLNSTPLGREPLPLHFQAALGNGWGSLKFGSLKPKMERQRLAANTPSVTRFAKVSV
ncbi:hypothetical protein [Kingella oralis]|jgi:hypothetical protein|uniref:hypothetical protein n=1 Tax=Kingella oralis TaxID=505 RepID=UPI003C701397